MSNVTIKASTSAVLPFTVNISGHDAQAPPWTRSYTFTSLATSYVVDEVEAQQLADVYTRGQSGQPVQAVRIDTSVLVTGGGLLSSSLHGAAAARGVVGGAGNLHAALSGAAAGTVTGSGVTLASITSGLTQFWSDNVANSDPLSIGKYHGASVQTVDNTGNAIEYPDTLSSPHAMSTTPAPRITYSASGGAVSGGNYLFFAPAGDNIYSDGGRGRSSLDYPRYDPGSSPAHIGPESGSNNIGFFYEGRRVITSFSMKLHSSWNLNPPIDWRVLTQWKRNEWYNVTDPQDSPILALEQKNGNYYMIQSGASIPGGALWTHSAAGTVDVWVRWVFDILFKQSGGSIRVYADFDNNGVYEYDSGPITGVATLSPGSNVNETGLPGPVAARFPGEGIESFFSQGVYEAAGGDRASFSNIAFHGTVGS